MALYVLDIPEEIEIEEKDKGEYSFYILKGERGEL